MTKYISILLLGLLSFSDLYSQHSVAREWNEVALEAIRKDFARPTVHARNLFHVSVAMYDAWAAYDHTAETYMLGKTVDGYTCLFSGISAPADLEAARDEAISYAAYRLLRYRFANSPGANQSLPKFDVLMVVDLGYDASVTSTDYTTGNPAHLGNYIAQCLINFGLQDNSNEQNDYANLFYSPINPPLVTNFSGNPNIQDLNRWQPLTLDVFIDQSGNQIPYNTPPFLSPEWGTVSPFALKASDLTIYTRNNADYWVYHDQGAPPQIDTANNSGFSNEYKWGFALVSKWSSHLDPTDGVMIDISPASIGNLPALPSTIPDLQNFYDDVNGGDTSQGHSVNPKTGLPYAPQMVPRGDYTRVLAEFWADGPDSETPPGHWYTLLNYVNDHPDFEKRFKGVGPELCDLEWDVKAYFTLGGAVHDAAITAWGNKGWYDYLRPISAIRCMADMGQSSDPGQPSYHPGGIELEPGFIEVVLAGDPLAGVGNADVGKIKVKAWRGPDYIGNPANTVAGVGWILAEDWWPYQRPSFVTPPFAGYVSGHSTFSRAAAEVMTLLTGDEFFPGGMGEFPVTMNTFLVFEDGPSVSFNLQWATYRDASDQCSLSRIWGGIHPPADDIPGRRMGIDIGVNAFALAESYFCAEKISLELYAFLEGPLDTTTMEMSTALNTQYAVLPGQTPFNPTHSAGAPGQPYTVAPWLYPGREGINFTNSDYDADVVDWILVTLLTSPSPADEVYSSAALLYKDGYIAMVDTCNTSLDPTQSYYVMLQHRNHLVAMSPNPIVISNNTLSYDFRSSPSYSVAGSSQKEVSPGVWAMYVGDLSQDSATGKFDINGEDYYEWVEENGFFGKYLPSDLNMNGDISGTDRTLWSINNGIFSGVPQN